MNRNESIVWRSMEWKWAKLGWIFFLYLCFAIHLLSLVICIPFLCHCKMCMSAYFQYNSYTHAHAHAHTERERPNAVSEYYFRYRIVEAISKCMDIICAIVECREGTACVYTRVRMVAMRYTPCTHSARTTVDDVDGYPRPPHRMGKVSLHIENQSTQQTKDMIYVLCALFTTLYGKPIALCHLQISISCVQTSFHTL